MSYDQHGNWLPPTEIIGSDLEDISWHEHDLIKVLKERGDLQGKESLKDLFELGHDSWELTDWENWPSGGQQVSFLHQYQEEYNAKKAAGTLQQAADEGWGLQFQRVIEEPWGQDMTYEAYTSNEIDFAHYNNNLAYRSTLNKLDVGNDLRSFRFKSSNIGKLREARDILSQEDYIVDEVWTRNNAMPYTNREQEQLDHFARFNQTRYFNPKTGITTYFDRSDSRSLDIKEKEAIQAGNFTQLQEPGSPQLLNVISGPPPEASYNADGVRVATKEDIKLMYQRYLGRDITYDYDTKTRDLAGVDDAGIDYWYNHGENTYSEVESQIAASLEAQGNIDRGRTFFNPNSSKESDNRDNLAPEPEKLVSPFTKSDNPLTINRTKITRPDYLPKADYDTIEGVV